MMQRNRGGWLGWLLFVFLVFGSQFVPPLARGLSQLTGQPISTGMVFGGLIGLYVVIAVVQSVVSGINNMNRNNEPRLPTNTTISSRPAQPPPLRKPPTALPMPTTPEPTRQSSNERNRGTPGAPSLRTPTNSMSPIRPPQFEPIIDPRILTFGILGLIFFGGFFVIALVVSGAL